ncbi:MAG: DUF1624 domain-containing protein [Actinomycetota bacterium]|nr:DUF1624 domain-containing protein [Actinomycetota bacterium]
MESPAPSTTTRSARVVGVDVARCLALLGMMATHILPGSDTEGVTWYQQLAGGRSAALFAVLAGVSVALVTGGMTPPRGQELSAARAGLVARAAVIGLVGLLVGGLDSGIAVILTYYAVLFVLALPFIGLRARTLAALAGAWAVGAPVVSHVVRGLLDAPAPGNPTLDRLVLEPGLLLTELLLTGYYPAFTWLAYLFAGMAAGRCLLGSTRVAAALAVLGGSLALLSWSAATVLLQRPGGHAVLAGALPSDFPTHGDLQESLVHGFFGTTPPTSWWWLTVWAPHSSTPVDMLHTTGTSLLVLGLAVLAGRVAPQALSAVFAAGTMTLTLYTVHVCALAAEVGPPRGTGALYAWHVAAALLLGATWRELVGRGPLERGAAAASRTARESVLWSRQRA